MSEELEHLGDQYEIISRLHEGGMGAIFKVRHKFLDQIRVVKVMHSKLSSESEFQERFQREARLATKVRHPNIAEVYDFSVQEGTAFLIMEYIEGANFGQLLEQGGPPKIETTLEICIQALKALGHIHERNLVHRDISPDNLMLTKDDLGRPLVKLIDLGIVKPLAEDTTLTKTGLFMGKLHYASPEQFGRTEEGVELDQRSDLYSFGIVLYQMLTGEVPYSGSESAVIAGHLFHPPKDFERADPDHRIPNSLRTIVLRAIEKKAQDRYQTAQEFADALNAQLSGQAPPPPASTTAGSEAPTAVEPPAAETSKHTEALLAGAERLAQLEQLDEARAQLETVLMLDPHHAGAQKLLRQVCDTQLAPLVGDASKLLISQSFEEAVDKLNRAIEIDPKNESVVRMLNDAKAGLHAKREKEELERKFEELKAAVEAALANDAPEDAEARLSEASLDLGTRAEFQQLHKEVTKARDQKVRREISGLLGRATASSKAKKYDEALELIEQALELNPDHSDARAQKRETQQALEEYQEKKRAKMVAQALADIQAALEASDFETASELLAEARATGGGDAAIQEKLEALQQRLDSEAEKQRLVVSYRGKIADAVETDDLDEAKQALDEARAQVTRATVFADLAEKIEQLSQEKEEQEKAEKLAKASEEIAAMLDASDFAGARFEVAKALRIAPDSEEIKALNEAIDQAEAEAAETEAAEKLQKQLAGLLETARGALEEGQLDEARTALGEVLELDAQNEAAAELGKTIEARAEELEAQRKAAAEAAELAESGQVTEARDLLRETLEFHPSDPAIQELLQSVESTLSEKEEAAERDEEVARLLDQAQKLETSGSFAQAEQALNKAEQLAPESTQVAKRLGAVQAAIVAQKAEADREADREAKVGELVETARGLVDKGQHELALAALAEAREVDPSSPVIGVLEAKVKEQVAQAEAEAAEAAAVEAQKAENAEKAVALVSSAGELRSKGELQEAEKALVEARKLDPDNAEASILLESVRTELRQAAEAASRTAEAEKKAKQARKLFAEGNLERSGVLVAEALELDPQLGAAQQLSSEIEQKLAEQREAAELEKKVGDLVTSARRKIEKTQLDAAVADLEEAKRLGGESAEITELLKQAQAPAVEDRTVVAESLPDLPMEAAPVESAAPAVERAPAIPVAEEPSAPTSLLANKKVLIAAGGGLVAIVALLFVLMGGEKTPDTPAQPTPVAAATQFVVDAAPWAQIVSIENANGDLVEVEGSGYTPVVLALEPGKYRVGLSNPAFGDVRYEEIEIVEGQAGRTRVVFSEVDVDSYFESVGWSE